MEKHAIIISSLLEHIKIFFNHGHVHNDSEKKWIELSKKYIYLY